MIEIFVKFVSEQMSDYRLRSDRSNIMRGIRKKEGEQTEKSLDEYQMFSIVYFFLRQNFRWRNNFERRLIQKEKSEEYFNDMVK